MLRSADAKPGEEFAMTAVAPVCPSKFGRIRDAVANRVMLLLGCVLSFGFVGYVLASFSDDQ
jgi:hypothetical protein